MKWLTSEKILYDSKWHTIKKVDDYQYIENIPGVGILPFKEEEDEENPLFDDFITIITGRIDEGEEHIESAVRELEEESGFKIDKDNFEKLGEMIISKDHKNKEVLYLADVTNAEEKEAEGDETEYEKKSNNFWVNKKELKENTLESDDSYLCTIACKYLLKGD